VLLRFVSRGGVGKVELSPVIRGTVSQKKRMGGDMEGEEFGYVEMPNSFTT
jgi:hypothetical protein